MTVKELKIRLSTLPEDLEVEYNGAPIIEAEEVHFLGYTYVELGGDCR